MALSSVLYTLGFLAVFLQQSNCQNELPVWDRESVQVLIDGISENTPIGATVAKLKCIDNEGDMVLYKSDASKTLQVRTNGDVIVWKNLVYDREAADGVQVSFSCTDIKGYGENNWANLRFEYSINDYNDHPPTFSSTSTEGYYFEISENAEIGTTLIPALTITDEDAGVNARLRQLYFLCDSKNATILQSLTPEGRETCDKFLVNFRQQAEGVYTASVVLKAALDYEVVPVYQSRLVAVDGDGVVISLTSSINIQLQIQDAQDTPPRFTNSGESTSVSEDIPVDTTLQFGVSARDGDTGAARRLEFEVIDDQENYIRLDSARITTTQDIDVYTSQVIINKEMDRETVGGTYLFGVKVYEMDDTTNPPTRTDATATATYSVFVGDINDNKPLFQPSQYDINVTEFNLNVEYNQVQVPGLHIICDDKDEPSNSQYRVRIVRQKFPEAYSISPDGFTFVGRGSMFLQVDNSKYLDFDVPEYRDQFVVLEAREINTQELLSSTATISIHLLDVNDNFPTFLRESYQFSVSESVENFPHSIGKVSATDKDFGENGQVRYTLERGDSDKFKLNEVSGEITLEGPVDYEDTQQYVFLIESRDLGDSPKKSQVQVTVDILNYNDLGPKFLQPSYQTAANESSLFFLTPIVIKATDVEDPDAQITYRIVSGQSPNNAFFIGERTGKLELREKLDYQQTPQDSQGNRLGQFKLTVEASDNGNPPQTNQVEVRVNVIDENNHPPIFAPTQYYKRMSEIAPSGFVVADVNATDADGGNFGRITYRLGPGDSSNFQVDSDSGVVTVADANIFDFDLNSVYTLYILATDGGAPQKTATATVSVDLLDANNKFPSFPKFLYKTNVNEDTAVDTSVLRVEARDEDASDLAYSIIRDTIGASDGNGNALIPSSSYNFRDAFRIESDGLNRGTIYVNGELNKDIAQEISFTVLVEDLNSDTGQQTATTKVTIIIKGDPEDRIAFDPQGVVYINEEENIGYPVATFRARDLKYDRLITQYERLPGSSNFLTLIPETGKVILARRVDYEQGPLEHLMIVRALSEDDAGVRSATGTLTASVLDANDNKPVFQRSRYNAVLSESAVYPDFVARIQATDRDSSSYGPITYRISGGIDAEDFFIFQAANDPGAEVLVASDRILDFNTRSQYELTIVAVDNPSMAASSTRQTSDVTLSITLIDENNNTPYFNDDNPSFVVPETAAIGQDIAVITAFDMDKGRNGEISYSLEEGDSDNGLQALSLFGISFSSGNIYVISSLLGKGGIKYHFSVRARDNGIRPNSNKIDVEVTVLSTEDDDGNPKWNGPPVNYVANAPEETPGHQLVDLMEQYDVIPRTGSVITYALSEFSEGYSSFSINSATGLITIEDSLDRERKETYELHVYAQDTNDTQRLRTGRSFILRLTDKNDNDATFTNPKKYLSCSLEIVRPLEITVMENTLSDKSVYLLQACEPDGPGYNDVIYSYYNEDEYCKMNNQLGVFTIKPDGHIVTERIIDYEDQNEYILCVQVKSVIPVVNRMKRSFEWNRTASPLHDDVAYIVIKVLDVNDNGPEFPGPEAVAVVPTSPGIGLVHQLDARDIDGPGYNNILYLIERSVFYPSDGGRPVLVREAFEIRGNTGAIFPKQPSYLNYAKGRFVLNIIAKDGINNTMTATQRLSIYVYEKGLTLKLVLDQSPETGFNYAEELIESLNAVDNRYDLTYISASENRHHDGVNLEKTDVCFVAVDTDNKEVLDIRSVVRLLNIEGYRDVLGMDKYKVEERGKCYPTKSSEDDVKWDDLWWVLVVVAIFVFVCCIICLILVCILYRNYKRYMETRKTYLVQQ